MATAMDVAKQRMPHTSVLNTWLPSSYNQGLDEEGQEALALSMNGLKQAAALGDLQRGAAFYTAAVRRFLSLKHELCDADRVELIQLLYRLITANLPVPFTSRRRWCSLLTKLLRKGKHLKLTLPWRPIFELLLQHSTSKLRVPAFTSRANQSSHVSQLARCAHQCRRHFPAGSSAEILEAVEPLLCPKDPLFFTGAALLSLLLPTHSSEGLVWQPKLLALWRSSGIEGSMEWEMLYMLLFKRLVKDAFFGRANAGVVDWSRLLPTVFSRTLLLLNLPGGTGPVHPKGSSFTNAATALLPSIYPSAMATLRAAARILVLSLPPLPRNPEQLPHPDMVQMAESDGPEAPEAAAGVEAAATAEEQAEVNAAAAATAAATPFADDGLERMVVGDGDGGPLAWIKLRQLLRCAEPYCHPSNYGGWSAFIGYLLQALCQFISWRRTRTSQFGHVLLSLFPSFAFSSSHAVPCVCLLFTHLTRTSVYSLFMCPNCPPLTCPTDHLSGLYERSGITARAELSLLPADISVLVRMLSPLATRALYSKAPQLTSMAQMACRYLCELAPEFILPAMQVRLFEGLQAVTATHQTPMALQTLTLFTAFHVDLSTSTMHALSERQPTDVSPAARRALATGPRAMLEALQLAMPGIDPNDLDKMASALRFFQQLCLFVPIAGPRWAQAPTSGASASPSAGKGAPLGSLSGDATPSAETLDAIGLQSREQTRRALEALDEHEALDAMAMQEEEAGVLCEWMPEFAEEVVRRLVRALDYFDKSNADGGRDSKLQSLYLMQWRHTTSLFFQQLSEDLFENSCLPQVLALLSRPSLLDTVKYVGALLSAASWANPALTLQKALPQAFAALLTKGSEPALKPLSPTELRWWLIVTSHLIRRTGDALLPYVPQLGLVLRLTCMHAEVEVMQASAKLRRNLLSALLGTYLLESRSLPPAVWKCAAAREAPWVTWGWRPPLQPAESRTAAVSPLWHEPSAAECAAAAELVEGTLAKGEAILRDVEADKIAASSDEVRGVVIEFNALVKGAFPFLQDEPSADGGGGPPVASARSTLLFEHPTSDNAPMAGVAVEEDEEEADGDNKGQHMDTSDGGEKERLPPLSSILPAAGKVSLPDAASPTPMTRFAHCLAALGKALSPREAVRNLASLMHVCVLLVSERQAGRFVTAKRQMLHIDQRACALRSGGRDKCQPRANLLTKIEYRHHQRLAATSFGAAARTPALMRVVELQLALSTHPYASVRMEAQAGFATALKLHPWLARSSLRTPISLLSSPTAAPHETKGAIFLLSTRATLKRVASDYSLLCAMLVGLVDARDHEKPKLQQRARNLYSALVDSVLAPLDGNRILPLPPLEDDSSSAPMDVPLSAEQERLVALLSRCYARGAAKDARYIRRAAAELLTRMPNPSPEPTAANSNGGGSGAAAAGAAPPADGRASETHWSREVGALCGLIMLPLTDEEQRFGLAARAAHGLTSPTIAVRRLSRAALSMLLTKPRAPGRLRKLPAAPPADLFAPLPESDEAWAQCELQDKLTAGWASSMRYAPPKCSADHAKPITLGPLADRLLTDATFVESIVKWLVTDHKSADNDGGQSHEHYHSAEAVVSSLLSPSRRWPSQPGHGVEFKDFELRHAQLWKGLAAHYGAAKLLPSLLPPLRKLMADGARDSQAVASETFAGLLRGSGRWLLSEQKALWAELGPMLRAALRACSVQSLGDWQACLRYCTFNRDPRRVGWLATMLVEDAESSVTSAAVDEGGEGGGGQEQRSLIQANHLRFLAPVVVELGWKGMPLLRRLLQGELMRAWVGHPYRQVREEVGSLLAIAMDACTPMPSNVAVVEIGNTIRAEIDAFVLHLTTVCSSPDLPEAPPLLESSSASSSAAISPVDVGGAELLLEPMEEAAKATARAARETLVRSVTHSCMQTRAFCVSDYAARLLPAVMSAAAQIHPPDLSNAAKATISLMAHLPMHAVRFADIVSTIRSLARGNSWRLRGGLLPFIAILAYRGQFVEPCTEHTNVLRATLHALVCDPQHEVREVSATVLGGFIRLHGPSERVHTLKWARQRTKKGKPLHERHAGVLALVALVQLAPYDVPAWLPEVIELLASFHNDPQPIKGAVSQAFADFKRTHQDNWARHRERFTSDQQDLISDMLVMPSFYA